MPGHRRKFNPRFEAEAVQMAIDTGQPIAEVARDLGIHDGTLGNWATKWRREHPEPDAWLYGPAWQDKLWQAEDDLAAGRTRSFADDGEFFRYLEGLNDAADR